MGGGVAMRAAAKVAGIGAFNGGILAAENPVVSAARQASRSVASVVSSSSDDLKLSIASNNSKTNSSVEKPFDDWEFAGEEDEMFMEAREPMPRLVFGGAPSIQEAKQATSDLSYALDRIYLLPNATNTQKLSDSEHVEIKSCLVSETSIASKHAIQAFKLLNENPKAQNVVASIASDPNVWNAVMQNSELVDFLQTHKTDVVFPNIEPNTTDSFVENTEIPETNESKSASKKSVMDYVEDFKQKITVTVAEMMDSLSGTFRNLFGGSPKDEYTLNGDGTAGISVEKTTMGAALMGLAIMVITVVVFKRA